MDEARLMDMHEKWLNKTVGFTRATMTRQAYSKMMKMFSEAGLKRTNFTLSIKQHSDESSYRKSKAQWMREWRNKNAFSCRRILKNTINP